MFTGIVEELGEVVATGDPAGRDGQASRLRIRGPAVTADARPGDSIAINGVCLTVVDLADGVFAADVVHETLARSSLGALGAGSQVNLERPLTLATRLGGHLVQGHVDGTGHIARRSPDGDAEVIRISLPPAAAGLARYIVEKGSIAVDGVSLTVVEVAADTLTISLIPATLERTTLGYKQPGEPVNLEVDVVAKYVERLLEGKS